MAIAIVPYTPDWITAVKTFNDRLAAGGVAPEFRFPESNVPHWLPKLDGRRLYQEYYLAVEGDAVHGAYILKFQDFLLRGETKRLVYYHLPVSEGTVNRVYSSVGVHMLRHALQTEPVLFCLGMGGLDRPLPQMLNAMGWKLHTVPFYFKVHHARRFLRNIGPLGQSRVRRFLSDLAAFSGIGSLGLQAVHWFRSRSADRGATAEPVDCFGTWADDLWQRCGSRYTLIAVRDSTTLNVLYPGSRSFFRLRVRRGSEIIGWAVVLDTQMRANKYFGDMRVGSIADGLAEPANAAAVVHAATRYLERAGVDLIVANHSHAAWREAFATSGYLQGPSNFIFAASKPLTEMLVPLDVHELYFNRGDGDGPVNL